MGKNGENKMIEVIFAVMHLIGVGMILLVTLFFGILAWSAGDERKTAYYKVSWERMERIK